MPDSSACTEEFYVVESGEVGGECGRVFHSGQMKCSTWNIDLDVFGIGQSIGIRCFGLRCSTWNKGELSAIR